MGIKSIIKEVAVGGSIGAGSIAVNMAGDSRKDLRTSERDWKRDAPKAVADERKYAEMRRKLDELKKKGKKKKHSGFKSFLFGRSVNEEFDMNDVVSRLKNTDIQSSSADLSVVSYGIEDDHGNVMRVTVRSDQAKEFEETIAKQLANNKDNIRNGISLKGDSLAEILFNLRDRFEIISVDFPIVPKDVVYDADRATREPSSIADTDDFGDQLDNDDQDDTQIDDQVPDQFDDTMGDNNPIDDGVSNDLDTEGDNVEEFGMEDETPNDEESLLKQVISMIKSQASAEQAKADAAAEESRAKQAEWSAIAAEKDVRRQEELARVEAQVQAQKDKQKEAKRMADLARFNVSKGTPNFSNESLSFLGDALALLEDQFDNPQALEKEKLQLRAKYQVQPTDDDATRNYKTTMFRLDMQQLNARIKAAQLTAQFQNTQRQQEKQRQTQDQRNEPAQNQPQQPQQNGTPQTPATNQNGQQ